MENELRRRNLEHVKEILDSKNNALVLVSSVIPPGARKGEALDVEVTLPAGSSVTSLRGGYLKECVLKNYDTAANLLNTPDKGNRPDYVFPAVWAQAKGQKPVARVLEARNPPVS